MKRARGVEKELLREKRNESKASIEDNAPPPSPPPPSIGKRGKGKTEAEVEAEEEEETLERKKSRHSFRRLPERTK